MRRKFLATVLSAILLFPPLFVFGSVTKVTYGTSTAITCTLASLAGGSARESTALDNTSNLFLDVLVYVACKLQTGTPGSDKQINVYVYGSEDGTNYTDNATGTDAAITLRSPSNLRVIGVLATPDSGALTYKSNPMSVAAAFGGVMPRKWGIVVENRTALTFSATEGDHAKSYTGITLTTVWIEIPKTLPLTDGEPAQWAA
jgi:hypothetical protein